MLFSRQDVSAFINKHFEAVWESVRPVPLVHIDFGNGIVLTRTLNGNVATSICNAEGQILDVLPGIYTPATYYDGLAQFRLLAHYVKQAKPREQQIRLRDYHQQKLAALRKKQPLRLVVNPLADFSKTLVVEKNLKVILASGIQYATAPSPGPTPTNYWVVPENRAKDLANWQPLREDTKHNETVRRRQIHELLAAQQATRSTAFTKRLYKDVLHADLDDPYLGLGETLARNYAFADEDKQR